MRELQFAKAAIATGWTLLLEELGLEHDDVQQVLLAGSFGTYLSPASAIRIGLVPKLPVLRIVSAGNVAGEGAKMALLSLRERAGAAALLEEVEYVELCDRADFNDKFVDQLAFPELSGPGPARRALIACGAIAQPAARIAAERGWPVDVHPLPPLLHNQPQRIAGEVEALGRARSRRRTTWWRWGTPTAAPTARSTRSASGSGCAGSRGCTATTCSPVPARIEAFFADQPGTYLFTDFLVKSFARTVETELGLDRHPELLRRLLRPLHARGLAGPGADPRAARGRRGRRRPARPPAHRRPHRPRRPRASAGGAGRLVRPAGFPGARVNRRRRGRTTALKRQFCPSTSPRCRERSTGRRRQRCEQLLAPGLGLGDLVEGEDVQALDEGLRLHRDGGAVLEELLAGAAAGGGEPGEECRRSWSGSGWTRRRRSWWPS